MTINLLTEKALLMLIDLQQAIDHPSWGERNNLNAEAKISFLLETWRSRDLPILHVKHMSTEAESHYHPERASNAFKAFAQPKPHEEVLEKDTNSAFIRTGLEQYLRDRGISEIVILGVITNNSVEATARMAGNLGFRTIVVSDGTYTFGKADYAGQWRTADDVHNMALANLSGEYAEVLCAAEVVGLLSAPDKKL